MTKTESSPVFGTKKATDIFIEYLLEQCSILKGVSLNKKLSSARIKELKIVLGSINQTAYGLAILCDKRLSNEATMLTRSFIEKLINYCFLIVCDEDDYKDYMDYSLQKIYRKLTRDISVGDKKLGIKYAGKVKLPKKVSEAVIKFTGSKGGEKTRWTKHSIDDRLDLIDKRTKIKISLIMLAKLAVYEDASEALHGTFYGCAFHTGYHLPGFDKKDKKAAHEQEEKNLSLICVYTGGLINELLGLINKYEKIGEFYKKSDINTDVATEMMNKVMQVPKKTKKQK